MAAGLQARPQIRHQKQLMEIKNKIYNFLRFSEKYIQTDMVYLASGGFWLILGQIINSAATFLLAIAFANLLPKETYGIYKYILSATSLLGVFFLTGMNVAVTQAVARGFEGVLRKSFWVQIKWGLIMFLAALVASAYYFLHGNQILGIAFLIAGSFSPLLNSANTYVAFLNGKRYFRSLTQYNILSVIISSALIFVTILITKNPIPLILVYFLGNSAVNVFFYWRTLRIFKPNNEQNPQSISYGKHLSLMNIALTIASYVDAPLIFHFSGAAGVATYAFAIAPPEQIKALFKNIGSLALPKFSEKTSVEIKQTLWRKVLIFGLIIALSVVCYIALAPFIYEIFFPKYIDSIFYSQIFALSIIATALYLPYSALQSQVAKKQLYVFNLWTYIAQIFLLLIFVYFWGIMGAILSRLIIRFLSLGFSLWLVKKI